ncbi:uncharacterized protein MYCFIDRAFT_151502 [Pseudocercospora fijiensis CIRAD86]|uniref:SnoaL-like domain-containing protein n=1 Tax=Pseudocercospora fijiensis (strain CIRAD86) TaxID=383855 RepID=M3BBA4_PSEFD|nr:uncharacterized protein MYCFIDRAFT_151502 [Pseudocercospora fijiensis CIRAD86]EME86498.1 hypothetical protein MYCFIDRAFT_151502 [Pseudocercospora fijiensis CIRAD86]
MSNISEVQTELTSLRTLVQSLSHRVTELEDINAIRKLHFAYGYYIDTCSYAEVVQLFAQNGEVIFLSGIYRGHASISRLYETWFQTLFTEGKPGPVNGFILDHLEMQDIITISPDGRTAQGRFRALLAGGNHTSRAYRPEGLPLQFWEAGVYENTYVKGEDGVWRIQRLDYVVQWQADYEKGWAHCEAHLKPFEKCFPEEPLGPDELLPEARGTWPERNDVKRHYAHPVLAAAGELKGSG